MRFYLIDRVTRIEIGKEIEGIKCWSLTNEIFNEHFPGNPIVPGVMLVESSAQLLGLLIEESHNEQFHIENGVYVLLSLIHKAKFRSFVIPGDQCVLKANLKILDLNRASGFVTTYVEGEPVAEVNLSFVIAKKDDFPENKYMGRHEEYVKVITNKLSDKT